MKILQRDVGKFCLVKWDDVGIVEGLIIDVDGNDVKIFSDDHINRATKDQIRQIGKRISFKTELTGF